MHGYGGGGPVTKDMIQRNRQLAYVDNADVQISGHTHDSWITTDMKVSVDYAGRVVQRPVLTAKLPSYKDEYKTGIGGWHVATGKPPKPVGAMWLIIQPDWCSQNSRYYLRPTIIQADN